MLEISFLLIIFLAHVAKEVAHCCCWLERRRWSPGLRAFDAEQVGQSILSSDMQHIHYGGNCCLVLIPLLCSTSVCLLVILRCRPLLPQLQLVWLDKGASSSYSPSRRLQPSNPIDRHIRLLSVKGMAVHLLLQPTEWERTGRTPFGVNDGHLELKTFSVPIRRIVCQCLQYANYYTHATW